MNMEYIWAWDKHERIWKANFDIGYSDTG
jgi:hypothetical protein